MMRARGTDFANCNVLCDRNGGSGCHLSENGHHYSFCQSCADKDATCPHGVQSPAACNTGCGMNLKIQMSLVADAASTAAMPAGDLVIEIKQLRDAFDGGMKDSSSVLAE